VTVRLKTSYIIQLCLGKDPNSSTSTYSALIEKMSSPKSCVMTWKQNYVDRSLLIVPSSPVTTTTAATSVTTEKTCVERWEMPCGRPNGVTFPPLPTTTYRRPQRHEFERQIKCIENAVRNFTDTVVSKSLLRPPAKLCRRLYVLPTVHLFIQPHIM